MVIKTDSEAPATLLSGLRAKPNIVRVKSVTIAKKG
jgi:hypothetical protein